MDARPKTSRAVALRKALRAPQPADIVYGLIRFAARAAGWVVVLALINMAAPYTGVNIAINPYSVATCGLLGVPGLGVLLCAGALF